MSTDTPSFSLFAQRTTLTLTLIGFALRLPLLNRFPFREDEAVYAYWALHAWREDPLFLTVWPDKPPLFIWLLSGTSQIFGTSAAAARWINIALSTLTIPVVAVCARKLNPSHNLAPLIAATTIALNPFAISFSATAFTDPMLVFCGTMAICMALCARSFWAGFWLAAAIMTKQQGLFYAPLIVGILLGVGSRTWKSAINFLFGTLIIIAPILYWDSLRWAVAPSPWDLSVRNYSALAVLPPSQWFERASAWGDLLWYLTGSWWAWGVLAIAGVWGGWQRFYPLLTSPKRGEELTQGARIWGEYRSDRSPRNGSLPNLGRARKGLFYHQPQQISILLIILWAAAFITLHMITTIQPWDRYLLPLAPTMALLVGCVLAKLVDFTFSARTKNGSERGQALGPIRERVTAIILTTAWLALLFAPAARAAMGGYPIGGDHGAYAGLDDAIAWINTEIGQEKDERAILYHRALGWHYRFYLYNPIRTGKVELRWFPHAVYLADNAAKISHRRRFVIEPAWSPVRDLAQQATIRRINVEKRHQFGEFVVLELSHQPQSFCDWCLCQLPNNRHIKPFFSVNSASLR